MSLDNEDRLVEMGHGSPQKLKISYTREFLLSLSELVECQKLPYGFDQSILSEFEDGPQERFRPFDSLSSQSFRCNEYGSSPPNRGSGNSYTHGIHGRWESRSSGGRTDRETDSQPDKESDPGRRYANQSRRPWQVPEHDGLLGSGSFPKPTGYAAGMAVPKSRSGDQFPLNRSNEPYHPPKPYKAVPHTRKETNDSFNDETFCSSEYTNEDRAEEEMKRRASFELMRKEQHEALQEKQKNPEKRKDKFDITFLVDGREDDSRVLKQNNEISSRDSNKSNVAATVPTSRPLVPPGFSSTLGEKIFGTQSSPHPRPSEVGDELEGSLLHSKVSQSPNRASRHPEEKQVSEKLHLVKQQLGNLSIHELLETKNGKNPNFPSALGASDETAGFTGEFPRNVEASVNSKLVEPGARDVRMNEVVTGSSPAQASSIMENHNAGSDVEETPNVGASSSHIEDMKVDDSSNPRMKQSSKFAQWFLEEDKKPVDDVPLNRPSDLFSLMVGSDRGSFGAFGDDTSKPITASFPLQRSEALDVCKKENFKALNHQDTEQLQVAGKPQRVSAILTCEDLEQSILSEVNVNHSTVTPPIQIWSGPEAKSEQQKAGMDNHASQHLLSLLQKGTGPQDVASSPILGIDASVKPEVKISKDADAGDSSSTEMTLETLFGTAFMKELKPAGTPPADNRGSVGAGRADNSDSHGLSFPILGNELRLSGDSGHGNNITEPNQRQQLQPVQEHFFGFGHRSEPDSSQVQAEFGAKPRGFDRPEVGLPLDDPMNLHDFMPARNLIKSELLSSRDAPPDISGKLAPLNLVFREDIPLRGSQESFPRSHDSRETEWSSLHAQSSSPDVHHSLLNHSGRLNLMESHRSHLSNFDSQMKCMPSEKIFDHDNSRHQFLTNMIQPPLNHPGTGLGGFDPTTHGPMFQQLQISGAFPPPHLSPGFPNGVPLPSHPGNQTSGFRQEVSAMQGIPFGQRQPNLNLGGFGIGPRAPGVGGGANHPEALQRLFEMELRSNAKQLHPLVASGYSQGVQDHELDLGFGFR